MVELRERKKDAAPTNTKTAASDTDSDADSKATKQPKSSSSPLVTLLTILLTLSGLVTLGLCVSFVTTNSLTFGYKVPNWRKFLPSTSKELILTTEQLAKFDGSDPSKPIYLAIMGKVYDVSAGAKYYGKDGSYNSFAGKDAARAYIT
ncbi:hypothetical protein HDV05_000574, partial [Chytridiales sp. JEL 0842]